MIKSLEQIQEEYGVPGEIGLEGIAKGGSILPQIVEDEEGKIDQVTLCISISEGQGETFNMPNEISLIRYKWIKGELHEFKENYKSDKFILSQEIKKSENFLLWGEEELKNLADKIIEKENASDIFIKNLQSIPMDELLEKCDKRLSELCKNPNKFTMHVPAQLDDADILFAEAFRRLKKLSKEV